MQCRKECSETMAVGEMMFTRGLSNESYVEMDEIDPDENRNSKETIVSILEGDEDDKENETKEDNDENEESDTSDASDIPDENRKTISDSEPQMTINFLNPHAIYPDISSDMLGALDSPFSFLAELPARVISHDIKDQSQDQEWQKLIEMLHMCHTGKRLEDKLANPFGEDYYLSKEFMDAVYEKFLDVNADKERNSKDFKTLRQVEMKYRLEELKERALPQDKDCLLFRLMTYEYDRYIKRIETEHRDNEMEFERLKDACAQDLSEFAEILLCEDYGASNNYSPKNNVTKDLDPYDMGVDYRHVSVLHIAAHRDLSQIASMYMRIYPLAVYEPDEPNPHDVLHKRTPVEVALDQEHDRVCHVIMKGMMNVRVCKLFTPDFYAARELRARYNLGEIVAKGTMKKTVIAVLDACVSPSLPILTTDWSYLPIEKERELEEMLWPREPRSELRYKYSYEILECDLNGSAGKNPSSNAPTTFHIISNCGDSDMGVGPAKHMLFRNLIRTKWNLFGRNFVMLNSLQYVIYMLALSLALFISAGQQNPDLYTNKIDKIRLSCEIISLIYTVGYLCNELYHVIWTIKINIKIRNAYFFTKWRKLIPLSSLFFILGLLLTIAIAPLQIHRFKYESRVVAAFSYFIVFMGLFDYFCLSKSLGIYSNTFKEIVKVDIVQFLVVVIVVVLAFSGSIYMYFCSLITFNANVNATVTTLDKSWNFWTILRKALRAFTESKEFQEEYASDYPADFIILTTIGVFFIMIVMGNLLIGQISDRYSKAKSRAEVQCEVDRAKMLTRIETLPLMRCMYKRYYISEMYVRHEELAKDLNEDSTCYNPKGSSLEDVQTLISKHILKWEINS